MNFSKYYFLRRILANIIISILLFYFSMDS